MPTKKTNAISMLKEDHKKVKQLFERFEDADGSPTKQKIVAQAIKELKVHTTIEEELFYPALRHEMEDPGVVEEADEEHHVAKVLIAELEKMTGDEKNWTAKFTVLAESVRHHIKEEEGDMFKKARKTGIDFNALGDQMLHMKQRLMLDGVPVDDEAKMIARSGLRGPSPSRRAEARIQVPLKRAA
jgi:hemerythrin-like domain-containing protein